MEPGHVVRIDRAVPVTVRGGGVQQRRVRVRVQQPVLRIHAQVPQELLPAVHPRLVVGEQTVGDRAVVPGVRRDARAGNVPAQYQLHVRVRIDELVHELVVRPLVLPDAHRLVGREDHRVLRVLLDDVARPGESLVVRVIRREEAHLQQEQSRAVDLTRVVVVVDRLAAAELPRRTLERLLEPLVREVLRQHDTTVALVVVVVIAPRDHVRDVRVLERGGSRLRVLPLVLLRQVLAVHPVARLDDHLGVPLLRTTGDVLELVLHELRRRLCVELRVRHVVEAPVIRRGLGLHRRVAVRHRRVRGQSAPHQQRHGAVVRDRIDLSTRVHVQQQIAAVRIRIRVLVHPLLRGVVPDERGDLPIVARALPREVQTVVLRLLGLLLAQRDRVDLIRVLPARHGRRVTLASRGHLTAVRRELLRRAVRAGALADSRAVRVERHRRVRHERRADLLRVVRDRRGRESHLSVRAARRRRGRAQRRLLRRLRVLDSQRDGGAGRFPGLGCGDQFDLLLTDRSHRHVQCERSGVHRLREDVLAAHPGGHLAAPGQGAGHARVPGLERGTGRRRLDRDRRGVGIPRLAIRDRDGLAQQVRVAERLVVGGERLARDLHLGHRPREGGGELAVTGVEVADRRVHAPVAHRRPVLDHL